jgi:hypothetical protein
MIIGYARVSTTEQNLSLRHDDLKPTFDASVDPTNVASLRCNPLLLNKLRLLVGGRSDEYADI